MNFRRMLITAAFYLPLACSAQEPSVLQLKSEPHHRLVLHNEYVNVYSVEVPPHDSVKLHKHEADAIGIVLSDSEITVHVPEKADSHQHVTKGQLRLQAAGYVHSTSINGDAPYRNVTVELLAKQESSQNLCGAVMANQPLHCPEPSATPNVGGLPQQPQFRTDKTEVALIRILPGQSVTLETPEFPQLVVMLDEVSVGAENSPRKLSRSGDFLWRNPEAVSQNFKNDSAVEIRLVAFAFKTGPSAK